MRQVSAAWLDYYQGRSLTVRRKLTALAEAPKTRADGCVRDHAQAYVDTAEILAKGTPIAGPNTLCAPPIISIGAGSHVTIQS